MAYLEPQEAWTNWRELFGSLLLLVSVSFSLLMNSFFGRSIGDVSCRYRVPFSPRREAFSIWALLYIWFLVSILVQFLWSANHDEFPNADLRVNALVASAWFLAGLWVVCFARLQRLALAAVVLVAAAAAALSAVVLGSGWDMAGVQGGTRSTQIASIAVPNALFAGWLAVAASLSIGIALKAGRAPRLARWEILMDGGDGGECGEEDGQDGIAAVLPLLVGVSAAAAVAIATKDPLLLLPAAWALAWQRTWVRSATAAIATVVTSGEIVVLLRMFV